MDIGMNWECGIGKVLNLDLLDLLDLLYQKYQKNKNQKSVEQNFC